MSGLLVPAQTPLLPAALLVLLAAALPGSAPGALTRPAAPACPTTPATAATAATDVETGQEPLPEAARARLVTLGGPVTEIVFALGLGEAVVGRDDGSLFPEEVRDRPALGYLRALAPEGLLALRPTAVLASEAAAPSAALDKVASLGIPVVRVPDADSVTGALERVRRVARLLERDEQGETLARAMEAELQAAHAGQPLGERPPRVLFVYARGPSALHVAGRDTPAAAMVELAGALNAVEAFEGYRPLTPEAVALAAPDVLLVPEASVDLLGGAEALWQHRALALTPAGANKAVVAFDEHALLGFGPRLPGTLAALRARLAEVVRP